MPSISWSRAIEIVLLFAILYVLKRKKFLFFDDCFSRFKHQTKTCLGFLNARSYFECYVFLSCCYSDLYSLFQTGSCVCFQKLFKELVLTFIIECHLRYPQNKPWNKISSICSAGWSENNMVITFTKAT